MFQESNLKLFSIGVVTEDKLVNSDYIVVAPMEQLSVSDGKLSKTESISSSKGTVKKRNTIIAKWIQNGQSNRATSPNVYKNESVRIFRYGDDDKYYWDTFLHEPNIRRLEEVTYSYSNKKTPLETYDENSSYYYTVSTLNKFIHLHTSTNDGEASGYDVVINTKTGTFSVIDTQNNQLIWQSVKKKLTITNFKEYVLNILEQITVQSGKTMTVTIGQSYSLTAPTINVIANTAINWTTPKFTLNGNIQLNGNLSCSATINAQTVNAPNGSVGG